MNSKRRSPSHFRVWRPLCAGVFATVLSWLAAPAGAWAIPREVLLLAHPDISIASINVQDLTSVYLGEKTLLSADEKIVPLDLAPLKSVFYEKVLNKSMTLISHYWTKAIFSGKGTPPREFNSVSSLMRHLYETPGGIGYAPPGTDYGKLKLIELMP